jgi:hypothetical protein
LHKLGSSNTLTAVVGLIYLSRQSWLAPSRQVSLQQRLEGGRQISERASTTTQHGAHRNTQAADQEEQRDGAAEQGTDTPARVCGC